MFNKKNILLLFVSLIIISLTVSTATANENTDIATDDNVTVQQDISKSVETQTTTLEKKTTKTEDKTATSSSTSTNTYYVTTNGKSTNTGAENSPYDLKTGVSKLQKDRNGNLIINGGTYKLSETIKLYAGTYSLTGKTGENVVFDGQNKVRILYLGSNVNAEIKNIVFANGKATSSDMGGTGGAIRVDAGGNIVINNNTFQKNDAATYGGAIANSAEGAKITNNVFNSNSASISGGAICTTSKSTSITDNTFNQNSGFRNGGAVYISGAGTIVQNNRFIKNLSNQTSGAIYNDADKTTISNNVFQENTAYRTGGAVYDQGSNLKLLNNEFIKNTVKNKDGIGDGAAAYIRGKSATIDGNTFTENQAEGSGGALYLDTGGNCIASKNVFKSNKAGINGGALFTRGTSNQITNNTFIKNTCTSNAPAIKDYGVKTVIQNNVNDKTSIYNGTIYIPGNGNSISITKNIFSDTEPVTNVNTVLTVNSVTGVVGDNIKLTATVKGTNGKLANGGNVVFKINGKTVTNKVSVKNGVATTSIVAVKGYNNGNVTATYSGTTGFNANKTSTPAKASISLRSAKLTVSVSSSTAKQYDTITFTAKVIDSATGKAISDNSKAFAIFKINGKTIKDSKNNTLKVEVKNGVATYKYVVPAGTAGITTNHETRTYNVTAGLSHPDYSSIGQAVTKFSVQRSEITVTTKSVVVNTTSKKLKIEAQIKDYKGNNVIGTSKINIKVNGKTIQNEGSSTTNITDGKIVLTLTLSQVSNIQSITIVVGERTAYESYRGNVTDITRVK